jgi:uncharacterized protein YkwD
MTELAFDLGSVLIVCYCVFVGYRRGFVLSASDALFMVATLILALQWAPTLANRATREFGVSSVPALIGVTLAFVAVMDAARRPVGRAIELNLRRARRDRGSHGRAPHVFGVVPGILRAAATIVLASTLVALQSPKQFAPGDFGLLSVERPLAAALKTGAVDGAQSLLVPGQAAGTTIIGLPDGGPSSLAVPFAPGTDSQLSMKAAADFLAMTNLARAQSGVPILTAAPLLDRVAGEHTLDMIHRAYFSHDSPDGISPADRVNAAGIGYRIVAENIVFAPSLESAFHSIMDSPAHRSNQLSPDFRRVGIGVAPADQGLMITVDFAD